MATNYYDSFIKKLQEIFMMDHAELDFGIYRIMNQKRQDILHFLEHELLPQVKTILSEAGSNDALSIKAKMQALEQQAASFNVSAENNPDYQKLKAKLEQSADASVLQNEVFSHLVTFFSRYYDNGDFISKRRYKDNTYAIPYNGEEVKLHWANADQYYIKSSEYFRDYTFVLPESRRKVHFVLKDATTEQNNNKAANNMERRFALFDEEGLPFIEEVGEDLNIYFTYELMPKATKQTDLMADALGKIMEVVPVNFTELISCKAPTKDNPNRTILEKHLTDYTAKNSFDYFIHKDLGSFLRRELDFYIKNEVMLLDDLDAAHIQGQLTIVKAIKQVGDKIIRMLAQLEDFQKRLWLKKKFVVQSDYCITLDRIPEELYAEICANDRQREEWVKLFAIDEIEKDLLHTAAYSVPLTEEFLRQNPFLVLDTAFFSAQFKHKLVKHLSDKGIDEQCNGLLINSENFQALELLQEKYRNGIKCVYTDPPYNTNASKIAYKNNYEHSSWMSLMQDRLKLGKNLLTEDGLLEIAIDDAEGNKLSLELDQIYGSNNKLGQIVVVQNPGGRHDDKYIATAHEYCLFYGKNSDYTKTNFLPLEDEDIATFKYEDERGLYRTREFRRSGNNSTREARPKMYYPLLIKNNLIFFITEEEFEKIYDKQKFDNQHINFLIDKYQSQGYDVLFPIDPQGIHRVWRWSLSSLKERYKDVFVEKKNQLYIIKVKDRLSDKEGLKPKSVWYKPKYTGVIGTETLKNMGLGVIFSYPKSPNTVYDSLIIGSDNDSIILDYFAGSATTAHAVILLNKDAQLESNRKFILAEMGIYFDSVTKPRIQKVIYSPDWRDGKPVSREGISQCFKYLRLEQYEDTLNNLEIKRNEQMEANFEEASTFKECYMLGYMLDTETRDSLLNLQQFENPFAMTLKTTKDNELVPTQVDMVETFNYLIGLNVETEDWYRNDNICVVTGRTHRDNLRTLVIWRNCTEINNDDLNTFFERMDFRTQDSEFDVIYVNGDNTLPNLRRDEDHWKVILTEEEFTKRMFENE